MTTNEGKKLYNERRNPPYPFDLIACKGDNSNQKVDYFMNYCKASEMKATDEGLKLENIFDLYTFY